MMTGIQRARKLTVCVTNCQRS